MSVSFSPRRLSLVMALALLCFAWPLAAAQADDFRASATSVITSVRGTNLELYNEGHAMPGGPFTGTVKSKADGPGGGYGVGVWNFNAGDSLTWAFARLDFDANGVGVAVWVITGGTGRWEGASGSGFMTVVLHDDGTATIEVDSSLSN